MVDGAVKAALWVGLIIAGIAALASAYAGVERTFWHGDSDLEAWLRLAAIVAAPLLGILLLAMYDKVEG